MRNTIVHNQLTDVQPVSEQWQLPPMQPTPCSFLAEHDTMWYRISLWSAWASCSGCAPPSSWCTPSFLGGRAAREAEQPLALCKHCSASTKMSANQCYQQYCHHKSKTQHHRSYRGKKFTLSNQKQDTGSKIAKHSTLIVISYKSCRMAFAQLLTLIYSHELSSTPASSSGNELGLKNGLWDKGLF